MLAKQAWQPGDLGVLRGVAECVAEEARTRGFASLTFASFAFIRNSLVPATIGGQFWDVLRQRCLPRKPVFRFQPGADLPAGQSG